MENIDGEPIERFWDFLWKSLKLLVDGSSPFEPTIKQQTGLAPVWCFIKGTNGKTSTVNLYERFWDFLDEQPVEPTDSRELNIDNCIEC